jgi:hypothetical protein
VVHIPAGGNAQAPGRAAKVPQPGGRVKKKDSRPLFLFDPFSCSSDYSSIVKSASFDTSFGKPGAVSSTLTLYRPGFRVD